MALLNGEIGGSIESPVDFGAIEEEDSNGNWIIRKLSLYDIIRNAVHVYGHEPYHKIIIRDLDSYGLELLEYRYDEPIYLIRRDNHNNYFNAYFDMPCSYLSTDNDNTVTGRLSTVPEDQFEILLDNTIENNQGAIFHFANDLITPYRVAKISYGDSAGYRLTDLVYAGDLITQAGDSVTSVLDKICNMLVEFEYFYDINGFFIFQKKPSIVNTLWSFPLDNVDMTKIPTIPEYAFEFYDQDLFTALSVSPNILNIRNDYSIWGERTTVQGVKIPIHLRYAIDSIPIQYTSIEVLDSEIVDYNNQYNTTLKGQRSTTYTTKDYDWREIIYRMALDYYKYNHLDNFEYKVAVANPEYPSGKTGYEQYYIDLQGFWRTLYNADIEEEIANKQDKINNIKLNQSVLQNMINNAQSEVNLFNQTKNTYETQIAEILQYEQKVAQLIASIETKTQQKEALAQDLTTITDETNIIYLNNRINMIEAEILEYNTLLASLQASPPPYSAEILLGELYNTQQQALKASDKIKELEIELQNSDNDLQQIENELLHLEETYYPKGHARQYWCKDLYEQPDTLNFWFDFLNPAKDSELINYSVKAIGVRPKVVNDANVKSIYYREVPNIIYGATLPPISYSFKTVQIPNMDDMFTISAQGKSAKARLDELINQHFYNMENINITSIPLYHLQPNSRILWSDAKTTLNGDYAISKFTIPLAYNGTMTITATKINT